VNLYGSIAWHEETLSEEGVYNENMADAVSDMSKLSTEPISKI